jgi:ParB family chromosome partitioning protein
MRSFHFEDLHVSRLNVRTNAEDAEATDALEASILVHGLLFPLVVHPTQDDDAPTGWGVLAGGRRLRAIGRLIERRELPADWPIDAIERNLSPAEITELSLSENLLRRELRAYEVHAAIARAAAEGATPEEIATNTGQRPAWVRQQLRLGQLEESVFAAYIAGELSADQAKAYAATEDQALQRQAFEHFRGGPSYNHTPSAIRAWFKVGDRELARLLALVGDLAYRKAGGRFELDLFADGPDADRGRVTDEELLRRLAAERLEQERAAVRVRCQDRDLRFQPEPPTFSGHVDEALAIDVEPDRAGRIALPDGDVVATLQILDSGAVEPRFWWASRKAKGEAGKPVPKREPAGLQPTAGEALERDSSYAQRARQDVKDEHGLSADGLQVMRSLRRQLLRAVLIVDARKQGGLGRDYLVWSQLRALGGSHGLRRTETGARGLAGEWGGGYEQEPRDVVDPYLKESLAHELWLEEWSALLKAGWMAEEDAAASLRAYVALGEDDKAVAAAVLAGWSLLRSANVPGWRVPAHDALAELAGADDAQLRRFWSPTSAFAGLFPKLKRLALAEPFVPRDSFKSWHTLADKPLAAAVSHVLEARKDWLHPLLSFGVGVAADDQVRAETEELEPAE